jgi:hypothetical protein
MVSLYRIFEFDPGDAEPTESHTYRMLMAEKRARERRRA